MDILLKYFPDLTEIQLHQFASLEVLYQQWNAQINVISRKDINSLYEKHVLHSLSIAACFQFQPGSNVIDIGTGGGFPGIPLAIFFPEVSFHLVDSIHKKLKIVEAIKSSIGLVNVTTQATRAEQVQHKKFDVALSRAVAPLKELWQWSAPLLKMNRPDDTDKGQRPISKAHPAGLICLKGGDLTKEITESQRMPFIVPIAGLFDEVYFKEKFILYIPSHNSD